jgi:hypothetical protein
MATTAMVPLQAGNNFAISEVMRKIGESIKSSRLDIDASLSLRLK